MAFKYMGSRRHGCVTFKELEEARKEIKRLKKQAEEDKKVIAILKDAAAFFCQDHLK